MRKEIISRSSSIVLIIFVLGFAGAAQQTGQTTVATDSPRALAESLQVSDGAPTNWWRYAAGKGFYPAPSQEVSLPRRAFIPGEQVEIGFSLPPSASANREIITARLLVTDLEGRSLVHIGDVIINADTISQLKPLVWKIANLPDGEYIFAIKFYDRSGKWILSRSDLIYVSSEYKRMREEALSAIARAKAALMPAKASSANTVANRRARTQPATQHNEILVDISLPSVEMMVEEAEMRWDSLTNSVEDVPYIRKKLTDATQYAQMLARKVDPFANLTGPMVKAYRSDIDDTLQPYAVYIPDGYSKTRAYPLVVSLHGAASNHILNLRRVFGKGNRPGESDFEATKYFPDFPKINYIVVSPYGRGEFNAYHGIGEEDVLHVIKDIKRAYNIDGDRVYLTGLSMGGDGAWSLGLHYPDMFAAIAPVCGPADFRLFLRQTPAPYEEKLITAGNYVELAENLLNLPVRIFHGDIDTAVSVEHSRAMAKRLEQLGYLGRSAQYIEYPGVKHFSWDYAYRDGRIFEWFDRFKRNANPRRVVYKTASSQYNKAYWVRIDRMERPREFALIDATIDASGRIDVKAQNITRYTLLLNNKLVPAGAEIQVWTNGQQSYRGRVPGSGEISFSIYSANGNEPRFVRDSTVDSNRHVLPDYVPSGFRAPLPAQSGKHIYVYGTIGGAEQTSLNKRMAERAANWGPGRRVRWTVKSDSEITDQDIRDNHLVLFGAVATNSLIAKIGDKLPIKMSPGRISANGRSFTGNDLGLQLSYFNPLNPEKYILIYGVASEKGAENLQRLSGAGLAARPAPDFAVLDGEGKVILAGLFDANWQLPKESLSKGN